MPAPQHENDQHRNVRCCVITVSDTRTVDTDTGGKLIISRLEAAGHLIHNYDILKDEPATIAKHVRELCSATACHAILLTGGTGLSARDSTVEAIEPLLQKQLDGFGELFRMLSYEQVGAAAMLSRAVAGVLNRTVIFLMPGSPEAVGLAMDKLILPELGHIVSLLAKPQSDA
ncbi:MAG: molybdenum cofactor biosynthesis protein MoaB [Planctomycetes bacterium]|nr:molybdenum cofactor biosynthesis protein MoaB [Planctomycetota bacterium]